MNITTLSNYIPITKCWESSLKVRPIWEASEWRTMQEKYHEIVGEEESTISLEQDNGLVIPYEIRHTDDKGRAVFATSKIKAGDPVWYPVQHAVFRKEEDFRTFLSALSFDLACDVLMWAYVESCECLYVPTPECYAATVELDEGSFMNTVSVGEVPNIDSNNIFNSTDEWAYYCAMRDIEPGEELVIDYKSFDEDDDELYWFADMMDEAWYGILDEDDYPTMVRNKRFAWDNRIIDDSTVPFFPSKSVPYSPPPRLELSTLN